MFYNNIGFVSANIVAMSFKDFAEHEKHHGLSKEQLKEAYELCKAEMKSQNAITEEVSNEKPI